MYDSTNSREVTNIDLFYVKYDIVDTLIVFSFELKTCNDESLTKRLLKLNVVLSLNRGS